MHREWAAILRLCLLLAGVAACALMSACTQIDQPKVEPFLAASTAPRKQELRWSNGKGPASLDPAMATAAPETDIIRALYDGLTDLDSKSLNAIPGVAERWESSEDGRVWTFHLRRDARWINGRSVTAADFVRSWRRLTQKGSSRADSHLWANIFGTNADAAQPPVIDGSLADEDPDLQEVPATPGANSNSSPQTRPSPTAQNATQPSSKPVRAPDRKLGPTALDKYTLVVHLQFPDPDLPKLVADPTFRPVYGDGSQLERQPLDATAVTNGAFRLESLEAGKLSVVRSDTFWNKRAVALDRIVFYASESPEEALRRYRSGEVDVVTNILLEPAALKLLAPYRDFRQTVYRAVNFYEFNTAQPPFSDRRFRQALSAAIDRERLTDAELQGNAEPAHSFFPSSPTSATTIGYNLETARDLMQKAGVTDPTALPPVRLVVNRNDTQIRIARSIGRMWRAGLGLETEVVVKELQEMDGVRSSGDYSVIRRGLVLGSNDRTADMAAIFGWPNPQVASDKVVPSTEPGRALRETTPAPPADNSVGVVTEEQAIFELRAMPLYFSTAYSLVKPYVLGFESNELDTPSAKEMSIDSEWRPESSPAAQ